MSFGCLRQESNPLPLVWHAGYHSDPLIKSATQQVQPDDTDALNAQQLELWPDEQ